MRWCSKLVDEEIQVIFTVDITEFAIAMSRVFLLDLGILEETL